MARADLAVRGGRMPEGTVADIAIAGERIVQIGGEFQAAADIDAGGMLVLPGGVDAHVHLSTPPGEGAGPVWVDDFTSGSAAALAGGITTVGNMTFSGPGESLLDALRREAGVAQRQTIADVLLHPVLGVPDDRNLTEMHELPDHGCASVKIFLSNPAFDRQVDGYIEAVRRAGQAGLVSMLHCEDAALIAYATRQLVEHGSTSLRYFAESRP